MQRRRKVATENGTAVPSVGLFGQNPSIPGFCSSSHPSDGAALSIDDNNQGSDSSTQRGPSSFEEVPHSVRNASPELRAAIRRKQNSESAKRSRERKKAEENEMHRKVKENSKRIFHLEKQVDDLAATLKAKRKITRNETEKQFPNIGKEGRDGGSSSKNM